MTRLLLTTLLQIDLRSGTTIRLTDGGFVVFGGQTFVSDHAVFGSIALIREISEGVGDEVPTLMVTLNPKNTASIVTLSQPVNSKSRMRLWTAEVDHDTGLIFGTPKLHRDTLIERMTVKVGLQSRRVDIEAAPRSIILLDKWAGNNLSAAFHQRVWPGETGEDGRTGLGDQVAWGVASPPRGSVSGGAGGGGGGGSRIFETGRFRDN